MPLETIPDFHENEMKTENRKQLVLLHVYFFIARESTEYRLQVKVLQFQMFTPFFKENLAQNQTVVCRFLSYSTNGQQEQINERA